MTKPATLVAAGSSQTTWTGTSTTSLAAATHIPEDARCERCGKPLRARLSVNAGIGARCALIALGGGRDV